mgnify:CR=1 FL=1|tara:strand:+ start:585 stop:731 length:147 start_codon:yes stop_codon:yes gene_type:complete
MPNKKYHGSKEAAKKLREYADNAYKKTSKRSKKADRMYGKPGCAKCGG